MSDSQKIAQAIAATRAGEQISDACARVIASQWHDGESGPGYAFVSTGAIPADRDMLWRNLYGDDPELSPADRDAADMLAEYLDTAGERGPVAGWSGLWL